MASFNRVVLVGNLTRDIELRYTPKGTAVTENALAINDKRKTDSGEWVEEVTFVDVTIWGRTAEIASQYLGKGAPILVEGRLKQDRWEKDGQKRSKLYVVCERMQMLGGKTGGGSPSSGSNSSSALPSGPGATTIQQGSPAASEATSSRASEPHAAEPTAGRGDAQPTGNGPGYDDDNIPF